MDHLTAPRRNISRIDVLFALFFLAASMSAQVNSGTPSFSAYDSHAVDTVNLQNLSLIHI